MQIHHLQHMQWLRFLTRGRHRERPSARYTPCPVRASSLTPSTGSGRTWHQLSKEGPRFPRGRDSTIVSRFASTTKSKIILTKRPVLILLSFYSYNENEHKTNGPDGHWCYKCQTQLISYWENIKYNPWYEIKGCKSWVPGFPEQSIRKRKPQIL